MSLLGLDIGTRTIKAVKLKKRSRQYYLDNYFLYDLLNSNKDYPATSNTESVLKNAIKTNGLKGQKVSCSVSENDVLNFELTLPRMPTKETDIAVMHEVSTQMDVPQTEISFDYFIRKNIGTSVKDQISIKAYCMRKHEIATRTKLLSDVNLKPDSIEPMMLATTAMLDFNGYLAAGKSWIVFDMGESLITSGLVINRELILTRSELTSCGAVNRALNEHLKCGYEKAEQLKLQYDFASGGNAQNQADTIMDEMYTKITGKLREMIEVYRDFTTSSGDIGGILLSGGGSRIKNIDQVLQLFFKTPVIVVNPFRHIDVSRTHQQSSPSEFDKIASYMSTAVGLALTDFNLGDGDEK
ncbi:MAG: pilus assembly protein PilM [Deltaproteobacteria bacterium]|nr:pilus assembly protein PilM [Deltaproteobacteria bacterium]